MARNSFPTGNTRVLGIVGDPIEQVLAPTLWSELCSKNGFDIVCIPMHVRPADLKNFLDGARGWKNLEGLIVTVPHKIEALKLVTVATARAHATGAVNSIRPDGQGGWIGDMLDGGGFLAAYEDRIRPVRGQRVLVVGSGGVGAAIALALGEAGASEVYVSDVNASRARALAARLGAHGVASKSVDPTAKGYDLVVNASPAGMRPEDPLPIDLDGATSDLAVADVVTKPADTRLLLAATALGCPVQGGLQMAEAQIPLQAEFFDLPPGDWRLSSSNSH